MLPNNDLNEIILDGISSGELPFRVIVMVNDGFQLPNKKNYYYESDYATGAIKENVLAWESIEKSYQFWFPTASLKDLRQFKTWLTDKGKLTPSDEPDVYYEVIGVTASHETLHKISGYQIEVTFRTQPFAFELNPQTKTYHSGDRIINSTNAPMYPKVTVYGVSGSQTYIKIGEQKIFLKSLDDKMTIECKFLQQNVFDKYDGLANSFMKGDFFAIPTGEHVIELGSGITKIEVLERWCWL